MSVALGCGLHGLPSEGISGEMLAFRFSAVGLQL